MPPVSPARRGCDLTRSAILLGSVLLFAGTAASPQSAEETLPPGPARERLIAEGEVHTYRVEVADAPLLVIVEQRSLDLVVEASGVEAAFSVDAGDHGWGDEVLLLEGSGSHRIEVRPKERLVGPARYAIGVEALPAEDAQRREALSLTSRAGREAFARDQEARRRAVALYREALAAWRTLGERRWEAGALYAISVLEKDLSELPAAAEDYQRALVIWQELGEPRLEAATWSELGLTRSKMGEIAAAREALGRALTLWQRLGERFNEARTQDNFCYLDLISGALPAAFACYEETRALFRDLGDRREEARLLNNLGGVYDGLGEPDAALEHYEQALALRRVLGDRRGEAETLNNIAVLHRVLGEWQEALRVYGQVGEIVTSLGDRTLQGILLGNLGFAYNSLGEPRRALTFLEGALTLRQETGDRRGEIIALNNLGSVWRNLGDLDKALDHHRRALELALALGDRRQEANTRMRLGEVQLDRNETSAVLREIEPALTALREAGNRRGELQTLQLQGRALSLAGRPREALPVLQDVLDRCRALRDRPGEADALQALAAAERSAGLAREARVHADEAVALVEELRTGFVSPDLRAAFLATQRRAYSLVIDLLMDRHAADPNGGHDRAAFEVSERARARGLLDALHAGNASRAGSAVPVALLEQRQSLRRRLSAKADQQLKQSGEKAAALGRESEALLADLDSVEAEIRRLDPLYAAAAAPPTLSVKDISRQLDPGTLLLEYSLGEEQSYLWAVGADSFQSFVLPSQRKIEDLTRQLYEELSTVEAGTGARSEAADTLSQLLLGSIWSEAARGRRLVVVPDAVLHLLPFAALSVPGSGGPLLEQIEVDYLPSATTLALQRQRLEGRAPASHWAAVFADPVFTAKDPRLTSPSTASRPAVAASIERGAPQEAPLSALERLPATRREAEAIVSMAPAGQVRTWLDLKANREEVLAGGLRDYRVVHFATHGLADTRKPELSGLVLSLVDATGQAREGLLSLTDIYDLDLDADLVVLSGCRTSLGKEVRGEGVMGLTRGFLYAGVPRVVASLWRVEDRTTATLMSRFYRALWQEHLPPAAALREAQRSLRRDPRYRDPYSWAGFVLQGDWR